jgi:hypothetical protein
MTVVDQASAATAEVTGKVESSLQKVENATNKVSEASKKADSSAKDLVTGFSGVATAGFSLYMTIDRVEKSQFALEKANLAVTRSNEAVDQAQKNYNKALEQFGAGSAQAKDAADKLSIAQQANTLASERASLAQGNVNQAMMQGALSIIPTVITMVSSLSSIRGILSSVTSAGAVAEGVAATATAAAAGPTTALTAASWGLNASLLANPLVWIVIAIAAFVAALYLAYTYCEPFRNAIDGIGAALKDNLGKAVEVIGAALTWLWNNVLVPIGNFIGAVLTAYINVLGAAFQWLYDNAVKPVGEALTWLWNNVLVPLGNFIYNTFIVYLQALVATFQWLANALKPVTDAVWGFFAGCNDAIGAAGNALAGFTSWFGGAVSGLCSAVVETIEDMTGQSDALTEAWAAKSVADVDAAMNSQLQLVTDSYNQQTAAIDAALQQSLTNIETYYTQCQTDAKTAFDIQYADFLNFYQSQLEPAQETELQKLVDKWAEHFDTQIEDMNSSYSEQISATNAFFDEMIDAANEKLNAIRESRKADLDDLELNMLLQKETLKTAFEEGKLTTEEYNKAVSELEKTYNASRRDMNEDYRLKELQSEKTVKAETEQINADKAARVEEITAEHNTEVLGMEQEKSDKIAEIENKDKALREAFANTVARLEQAKADETRLAVIAAEEAKTAAHERFEGQTKAIVETAEADRQRIIKESHDKISSEGKSWGEQISDWWGGLTSGITNAWGGMCSGLSSWWSDTSSGISSAVGGFCAGVTDWFNGLSAAITGGSIWPDMLNSMTEQTAVGMDDITDEFQVGLDAVQEQVIETSDTVVSATEVQGEAFEQQTVDVQEAADAQIAAQKKVQNVFSGYADKLKSGFFDRVTSQSAAFKEEVTSLAERMVSSWNDMSFTTLAKTAVMADSIQRFADEWGLSWTEAEAIITKAADGITDAIEKAAEAQVAAQQAVQDKFAGYADTLKSTFFDRVTSQSAAFKDEVASLAQRVVDSWNDMSGVALAKSAIMAGSIQRFADQWGISWDEAHTIITEAAEGIDAEMRRIPESIEQQLIGEAQADFQAFKDCMTGKARTLNTDVTAEIDGLASNITNLINRGLVGEAQAEMQAYVDCNTNKTATMVQDINGLMERLTTDYNAQLAAMTAEADSLTGAQRIAVLRNIDELTAGYESRMAQLRAWQQQLLDSMVTDADRALAAIQGRLRAAMDRAEAFTAALAAAGIVAPTGMYVGSGKLGGITYPVALGGGGVVEHPTLALLGERGKEAVIPLEAYGLGGGRTVNITITGPLVAVEGSADRETAELAARLVEERLRSIILEQTSSGAPSTSKRIRYGNMVSI